MRIATAALAALALVAAPASANHEQRAGCTLLAAGADRYTGVVTAAVYASDEAAEAHAVHCAVEVNGVAGPSVYAWWEEPVAAGVVEFTAAAGDVISLCQETVSPFGSWRHCAVAPAAGVLPGPVAAATTW
ncbi:MAG TPA: hypothetical protein VNA20_12420 [Frankiaceae bacterium]|nr:hypothetical protein [Frankiaceae bacterium]